MASDYKPGDIVYGSFPFTDREETKSRIFLIFAVPHKTFVWAVMLSSEDSVGQDDGSAYLIDSNDVNFKLPKKTVIRMNIIQTIDKRAIDRKYGVLKSDAFERVMGFIKNCLPAPDEMP